MQANLARACRTTGASLIGLALSMMHTPASADASDQMSLSHCGFYLVEPNIGDLTSGYQHCGSSFILIKIHWSNGGSYGKCVPPWDEYLFYRDGTHRVVDAYYVKTPPNVATVNGRRYCSLSQPKV